MGSHSLLDRAVGACFLVLLGAAALFVAVRLILAVWIVLAVIAFVVIMTAIGVAVWRSRTRGW